jgi:23S rRNA (uridine2552-2'-O)-methyltransferase
MADRNRRGRRSRSSDRWLTRQRKDPFTRAASQGGKGSRAHFKLEQLDARFKLIRPGMRVLELGAAPGGWTCFVEERIGRTGQLIAVDERPVSVSGSTVLIEGLVGDVETDKKIDRIVGDHKVDLVLSDMAPNISGIRAADQARTMELVELAERSADKWLNAGGSLVVKVFQGTGTQEWVRHIRTKFERFKQVKPKASRPESREMYAVGQQYRR